ncbi:hypothetical protein ACTFIY_009672 [Dictyostelium cf. discoideum]
MLRDHLEVNQACVIVCRLSKRIHVVPCHKTIDAEHTAQLLLNHAFRLHGYPSTIVSYRDPRFLSDIWSRWTKTMYTKLKMTVAHRAQADGKTERMNREIIRKNCGTFTITTIHGNNVTLDLIGYPKKLNVFNKIKS